MSGPYAAGLGIKKRRNSHVFTSDGEETAEGQIFFSCEDAAPVLKKRRRVTHADAEVIPKFRPEDNISNINSWLHKIDQLGDIYGWDSIEKTFVMQLRLLGSARHWYDDLDDYNLDWEGWKSALKTAFPRSVDYVDRLEVMLARTKKDSETMTKYFHDKVSLLKKCEIQGESAISCIIRGLPVELRANAKAYQCETPELLYYGYLSSLENYRKVETAAVIRKTTWRRGVTDGSSTTPQQSGVKRCYACRRVGHDARDCRTQQRCDTCQRAGHTSATCWFAAAPGSSRQQVQIPRVTYYMIRMALLISWFWAAAFTCAPILGFGVYYDPNTATCIRYRNAVDPVDFTYAVLYVFVGTILCVILVYCNLAVIRALYAISTPRSGGPIVRRVSKSSCRQRERSLNGSAPQHNSATAEEVAFSLLMATLSVLFMICWLPQMITSTLYLALGQPYWSRLQPLANLSDLLMLLNYVLDPIIYVLMRRSRFTLSSICKSITYCFKRRSHRTSTESMKTSCCPQETMLVSESSGAEMKLIKPIIPVPTAAIIKIDD